MAQVALEQVLRLAERLSPSERAALIQHLQEMPGEARGWTLDDIRAEHEHRKAAGEFAPTVSLMGIYARPGLDLSFDAVQAAIHESMSE